jgi:serine O-acetyltransferase
MRRKFGFDAYGVSQDMPDPVARSIQAMLDHMHAVDERIERMCTTLRKVDASYRDGRLPELRDEDFADILADVDSCCPPREEQHTEDAAQDERAADAGPRLRNG